MTQETNFAELQTLKEQFALLSRKLDKQAIINENMIKKAMAQSISVIERKYKSSFQVALIGAPVLTVFFLVMGFHWGFILLMDVIAVAEFLLDKRCYKALAPQQLVTLNMTDAAERAIRYRKLRSLTHRILLIPNIVLIVWTILIACDYSWNVPILSLCLVVIAVAVEIHVYREKKVNRNLDSLLKHIQELRE
ncbi:MAG TPA: hypothetical protein H9819_09870 [Candidatus Bacteroides merdipullorum]|uniref:Uncharacterized protein n=1 Tax=Candidatus Bacteroides merdipullorum TaxID=2838474 RepID=A0A9D2A9Q5_9BACE|nr:hypothetical protein [Candidatus Bacteroides merdipullorum]